ncbi:hypothetical protein MAM1_0035d02656 [Mucor ambiguus]|uniref:Uncharacterized protein n=1 Tax=Mucor ambiguus TaxID=91626 RepID=A0A0C9LSW0_9FUNG|nr:hypothetical protein MAM1_0035d02656 [Mucor ambiguus]
MSQKRPANKCDSEPAHKKQMAVGMNQKVNNPQHITYCIENKATFIFPAFCEKFDLFRRDYAYSRYKNIISKYLPDDCDRLTKEFNLWKSSFASKQFWLQKTRLVTDLDAHLSSAEYVQKVIQQEIQVLPDVNSSTSVRVSSHDTTHRSTSPSIDDNTTSITSNSDENSTDDSASADMTRHNDADLLDLPGHQTSSTLLSHANASAGWMFKGTNISTLFMIFQQKVVDITASALLHMETSIHEALALSHILLLAPQQHSQLMIDVFTEEILDALTENLVHESLKLKLDTGDVICGKVFRVIDSVQMHQLDNDGANS